MACNGLGPTHLPPVDAAAAGLMDQAHVKLIPTEWNRPQQMHTGSMFISFINDGGPCIRNMHVQTVVQTVVQWVG